jgi:hypothetical protein
MDPTGVDIGSGGHMRGKMADTLLDPSQRLRQQELQVYQSALLKRRTWWRHGLLLAATNASHLGPALGQRAL